MSFFWNQKTFVDHYNQAYGFNPTEVLTYLGPLNLSPDDVFVDFGCGRGHALLTASSLVKTAVGVDDSPAQLEEARQLTQGQENIRLLAASFLDCDLTDLRCTKGAARKALHHLNDDEKKVFFQRISRNFNPGALFIIEDGIFDFDRSLVEEMLPKILEEAAPYYGEGWEKKKEDFIFCMTQEFPTGIKAWEEALAAGGFKLLERKRTTCFYGSLLAQKVS